jgi:integral membrane protein
MGLSIHTTIKKMKQYINSPLGRLRLVAFLEGLSLIVLVFVGMPFKYWMGNPMLVKTIGPVHGVLFVVYVIITLGVAAEQQWKFMTTTWKVLLASFVPFGTFYIDKTILRKGAAAE